MRIFGLIGICLKQREDATDAAGMPSPIQTTVADAGSELPLPGTSTQNVQPSQDADLPNPVASAKELIKKRRQEKEEQDLQVILFLYCLYRSSQL